MKSLDRGVSATNELMSSLFLFLLPAILECLAVVVVFFVMYRQSLLGGIVLLGVILYALATLLITQYRRKLGYYLVHRDFFLFLYSFTRMTISQHIVFLFECLLAYYLYEKMLNIFKYFVV